MNRTPILVESDRDIRIIIELVPYLELLEATDVKYNDVKRLISIGNVKFDRDGRVVELQRTSSKERLDQKRYLLFKSFTACVDAYMNARKSLDDGCELEAYHHVSRVLTEWANTTVIEQDGYVSESVWQQLKPINPGLYRLYNEFIGSGETMRQRVELVPIACEFSIMKNMDSRLTPLIDILQQSEIGMSLKDILEHDEFKEVAAYMSMVMEKLFLKGYVQKSYVFPNNSSKEVGMLPVYRWHTERDSRGDE